jgi:hypothetical protein
MMNLSCGCIVCPAHKTDFCGKMADSSSPKSLIDRSFALCHAVVAKSINSSKQKKNETEFNVQNQHIPVLHDAVTDGRYGAN